MAEIVAVRRVAAEQVVEFSEQEEVLWKQWMFLKDSGLDDSQIAIRCMVPIQSIDSVKWKAERNGSYEQWRRVTVWKDFIIERFVETYEEARKLDPVGVWKTLAAMVTRLAVSEEEKESIKQLNAPSVKQLELDASQIDKYGGVITESIIRRRTVTVGQDNQDIGEQVHSEDEASDNGDKRPESEAVKVPII